MTSDGLRVPAATRRRAARVFVWVLGALVVLAVAGAAWIGVRGVLAYGHLRDAQSAVSALRTTLGEDPAAAAAAVPAISVDTRAARSLTGDPVWRAGELLPWVGPQLAAVRTVAASIDDVASHALGPLADLADDFDLASLKPVDGRIDLAPFAGLHEAAAASAADVGGAAASVSAIDRTPLLGPLRDSIGDVAGMLDQTRDLTDALSRATALLPAMLGADGPRDYLVVFQNNAEWRSLGGIVGAMALVHTDGGALSLTAQGSSSDFRKFDESVLPLDADVDQVFGSRPGQWIQNVTLVPDFRVSGPLAREMWLRVMGQEVDGVISVDPVALSYLLAATGPVALPTGDVLSADNAVSLLLNEVYFRFPRPADQDAFFAVAAAGVFDALSHGDPDPATLVDALAKAGDEHRLLLWSAHDDDQELLAGTTLAGGLPVTDASTARFGSFLNDGTGSKMSYYLTAEPTLTWDSCTLSPDGRAAGDATLAVTVTSTAPADAATALPAYITGGGMFGVPAGITRVVGYLYLPDGWTLRAASLVDSTGQTHGFGGGIHDGRRVLSYTVDLQPGMSLTATVTATSPAPGAATVDLTSTPLLVSPPRIATTCR